MFNDIENLVQQVDQFKRNITSSENLIHTLKEVSIYFQQETETIRILTNALNAETNDRKQAFSELMQYIEHSQTEMFAQNLLLIEKTVSQSLEEQQKYLGVIDEFARQESDRALEQSEAQLLLLQTTAKREDLNDLQEKVQELRNIYQDFVNVQSDLSKEMKIFQYDIVERIDASSEKLRVMLDHSMEQTKRNATSLEETLVTQTRAIELQQKNILSQLQDLIIAQKMEFKTFQHNVEQLLEKNTLGMSEIALKQSKSSIEKIDEYFLKHSNTAKMQQKELLEVITMQNDKIVKLEKKISEVNTIQKNEIGKLEKKTTTITMLSAITLIAVIITIFV